MGLPGVRAQTRQCECGGISAWLLGAGQHAGLIRSLGTSSTMGGAYRHQAGHGGGTAGTDGGWRWLAVAAGHSVLMAAAALALSEPDAAQTLGSFGGVEFQEPDLSLPNLRLSCDGSEGASKVGSSARISCHLARRRRAIFADISPLTHSVRQLGSVSRPRPPGSHWKEEIVGAWRGQAAATDFMAPLIHWHDCKNRYRSQNKRALGRWLLLESHVS